MAERPSFWSRGFIALAFVVGSVTQARGQRPADIAESFAQVAQRLMADDRATPTWSSTSERPLLQRLYERAKWQPLWMVDAHLSTQAFQVVDYLADIETRGLRPSDYDVDTLHTMTIAIADGRASTEVIARTDLAISRSLLRALTHLHSGQVDPTALGFDLPNTREDLDVAALVADASRATDVRSIIATAEPPYVNYRLLVRALTRYRTLAADSLLRLPPNATRTINPGDRYDGVPELRRLLLAVGDLAPERVSQREAAGLFHYDGALADAIVAFQRRHGLEPDGKIGRSTMAQLRVPIAERVRQIELSLERWRWLPHSMPERFLLVNIPEFQLSVYDVDSAQQAPVLGMKVIVGQARGRHHTPIFVGTMREVVLRPYWDVPPPIARNELLPIIRRQPSYLEREALEIVQGSEQGAVRYPPTAANLAKVAAGTLRLRQRPGANNALGLIKLVFPNRYNVYLHGTPEQRLFLRPRRDFSHGCIRVESPSALAQLLLREVPGWSRAAIDSATRGTQTQHISVARPITVFVFYVTATADSSGTTHFYPDLYGHDVALAKALSGATASVRYPVASSTSRRTER